MKSTQRQTLRCPIDVFKYHDYRAFLSDFYLAKKPKGFSYRAFSMAAGLGAPNYLQLVINGKRNLGPETAARFAATCGLGKEATSYFLVLVQFNQAQSTEERTSLYQRLRAFKRYRRLHKLQLADAAYHATWYVPAIRELALCSSFREDPSWIATTLVPTITERQAREALDTLTALGLLQRDSEGRLRQHAQVVSTGPETAGLHIASYHRQMLERATAALELPATERDLTSLTMCLGPAAFSRLKARLAELRRELIELCVTEAEPTRVLQLNLQLFPLSQDTGTATSSPVNTTAPSKPVHNPSQENVR